MKQKKVDTRGGKREGSGRKAREPTHPLAFRISLNLFQKIKEKYPKGIKDQFIEFLKGLLML
jgi:hypothetical protein